MSQRPRQVEPLNEHLEGHILNSKASKLRARTRANISATVGSPPQIHPQRQRVDEKPKSSKTGSERPRSETLPHPRCHRSLPNNTNAACTTMKAVALYCQPTRDQLLHLNRPLHRHRGTR